jgi:ankyrin repeat protein
LSRPEAAELGRLLSEFDAFINDVEPDVPTSDELESAADEGDAERIAELLAGGARPTVTALTWAASSGSAESVRRLLDAGADPNARDSYGVTQIFFAAAGGHGATCAFLVKPEATNIGESFWPTKPSGGHADTLALLLDRGVDPNQRFAPLGQYEVYSATPLIAAAAFGCVPCVKLLVARGANVSDRDALGLTASDWAKKNGHAEVVALLS